MPDNKKYIIEIEGIEGQSVKDANWWAEKKDSLYAKYPEARVFEIADYDEKDSNENDQYLIGIPGMEGASVKDFAWLSEKKDSLYQKYPEASVMRVRYIDHDREQYDAYKGWLQQQQQLQSEYNMADTPERKRQLKDELDVINEQIEAGAAGYEANPYTIAQKEYEAEMIKAQKEYEEKLPQLIRQEIGSGQIELNRRVYHTGYRLQSNEEILKGFKDVKARREGGTGGTLPIMVPKSELPEMPEFTEEQKAAKERGEIIELTEEQRAAVRERMQYYLEGHLPPENMSMGQIQEAWYGPQAIEHSNYYAASGLMDAYDYLRENKQSVAQGMWYSISDSPWQHELEKVHQVLEKLENEFGNLDVAEEQIDAALNHSEKVLLQAYFLLASEEAKVSNAFVGGEIAGESLKIAAEMALVTAVTGGTGTGPFAAALASTKVGQFLTRIGGKLLTSLSKWYLRGSKVQKVLGGTAKVLGGTAKYAAKSAVFTALAPTTYKHIAEKKLQIDENGRLMDDDSDIVRYAAEEVIENFTEFSGEGILKAFGLAGDALKGTKWGGKVANAVGSSKFGKAMSWLSNTEGMQFMSNLGFQGLPIEVLEELEGAVLNEITGLNSDALEQFFDADNAAAMLIGFAPMTLLGAGTSAASMGLAKHELNSTQRNLYNVLSQNYTTEQIDNVVNAAMAATNPNEVAAALQPLAAGLAGGGATQEQLAALLDYGKAVASYKSMMTVNEERDRSLIDAKYTEIESSVGDFWVKMAEDIDAVRQVRVAELKDGRTVFVTSQANEQGEFTIKDAKTGQTGFAKESDIAEQQDEQGNAVRLDNTMNIDDFLNGEIMAERHSSEAKRMSDERQAQIDAMKQRLAANKQINLGTEEAPQIVLAQSTNSNGVTVVDETGNSAMLTWEQVGNAIGTPLNVRTDEQVVEQEIADLLARQAERKAALAQKNVIAPAQADKAITEAEQSIEAANPMYIPTNPDGSVDENAFWNENPEGWAEWNDQQNNDGGVDSYEQIAAAEAEMEARLTEMQKLQATSNPANRRKAKAEAQQISARLAKIDALKKQYEEKLMTPEQKRAKVEQAIKDRAAKWQGLTGVKVVVVENPSEIKNADVIQAMAQGTRVMAWTSNNEAYVFLPEIDSVEMLDQKFAHEVVAHIGIKQLLGEEGYKAFCEKVWTVMSPTAQKHFLAYPGVKGNPVLAADEYIAHIAEQMGSGVANMEEQTVWQKIVQFFKEMLNSILGIYAQELTEQEILNNIKLSFSNLMEKGASQVATEETQLSAKQPSNAELALQDYASEMTTSEMTSAVSYELGAAQKAYEDLLNNPVAISEGEGLKEYAARKAQYQEDLRRAKEEYELRKEMLDFLNSKQETKADNGVISGNIYGAEGATLAAAVNQKNNVYGQGVPGLDAVSTANYFYLYENAKNAGYAYSNGEINVTFGIPIKGNEEYINLITEQLENGTFENNESADLSIEEIVSRKRQSTGNRADVAAQRGGYERNDSSLGNGAVDGVSDDGTSIADSQLNAGESARRPASIDNTSAPRSLEPTIVETENGEAVAETDGNGSVRFSALTYEQGGRNYLVNWLAREKYMDKAEKDFIIATLDQQYELAKRLGEEFPAFGAWSSAEVNVDKEGNPVMSVIKANGDYSMNLDFSLICKKRRPLNALLDVMIADRMLDMRSLNEAEIAKINKVIQRHGFEVACALCFVDSKRYRVVKVATDFADLYNELVNSLIPEGSGIEAVESNYAGYEYINERNAEKTGRRLETVPDAELNWAKVDEILEGVKTPKSVEEKVAWMLRNNPSQRKLVNATDFVTNLGFESVKKNNPELLKIYNAKKGTGGPKASFGDVQYLNDILKSKSFTPKKAYSVGGVRVQSFSDYMGHMFFDYMQMVAELSAKGLPAHAYTKEEAFARIFGMTGMKINMSLVPAVADNGVAPGLDAEGNYVWAVPYTDELGNEIQGQTFPPDVAFELQRDPRYSKNVGIIAVGVSDEHIIKMLNDDQIHFVIPYHKSSLNPEVAKLTKIDKYADYTNVQNTRLGSEFANLDKDQKKSELKKRAFDFYKSLAKTKDPKATAAEYLEHCRQNGLIPKYDQFSGHENYYKLLVDFNTYDFNTGEYAPQGPVTMTFPEELESLVKASVASNEELESDLKDKVGKMAEDVKAELGGTRFSARTAEQRQALFDKAKDQFGLTNNFNAAGYMLPDGSLLDFSESKDGGNPNQRSQDHREIEGIIMDEGIEYDSRWMYLADFMNEGAIRLLPEYAGINLMKAPTKEQRQRLFDFIYKYNGEVILEIADERLNNVAYVEYDRRTSPSRIFRDIDRYFNEGIVPQQDTRFSASNNNQEIFVSNAAKAVEGIKQEKATPAQWLAMLEKNGGLKAAEDKWMGLSDWLKASDKKTLTKDEVLQFINENKIQIEEVHYSEDGMTDDEMFETYIQSQEGMEHVNYQFSVDAADYAREQLEGQDLYDDEYEEELSRLESEYYEDDLYGTNYDMAVAKVREQWEEDGKKGVGEGERMINDTRLDYTTEGLENKHEIALTIPTIEPYEGSLPDVHFFDAGEGRAVAWIRFGETSIYDKKDNAYKDVLVIDEIQSQRHQDAREKGYTAKKEAEEYSARMNEKYGTTHYGWQTKATPEEYAEYGALVATLTKGVPSAPFEKNWHELAMKRMLRYAAENGYDAIAWTKGDQQAGRYNIGGVVKDIYYVGMFPISRDSEEKVRYVDINLKYRHSYHLGVAEDGLIKLEYDEDGEELKDEERSFKDKSLADVVGKEVASQIMQMDEQTSLTPEDLKVGGEGMKGFYDKMLPAFMNKYGKKWGVKVEDIDLPNLEDGLTMHSVPVTEEMKASVMEGQTMFSVSTPAENKYTQEHLPNYMFDTDVRFSLSKNNRQTITGWMNKRKDLSENVKEEVLNLIDQYSDATLQLCIGKWFSQGTIALPEDLDQCVQAVASAKKAKVNALSYSNPMEIINEFGIVKSKKKPIDPDTVSTLKRSKALDNGIVIYDVEESEESRKNLREIINTHYGVNASPWCLLQGDENGNLTEKSAEFWQSYNAVPKRVVFRNGKLLAFYATSSKFEKVWWDRLDRPWPGIPVSYRETADPLKREVTRLASERTGKLGKIVSIMREDRLDNGGKAVTEWASMAEDDINLYEKRDSQRRVIAGYIYGVQDENQANPISRFFAKLSNKVIPKRLVWARLGEETIDADALGRITSYRNGDVQIDYSDNRIVVQESETYEEDGRTWRRITGYYEFTKGGELVATGARVDGKMVDVTDKEGLSQYEGQARPWFEKAQDLRENTQQRMAEMKERIQAEEKQTRFSAIAPHESSMDEIDQMFASWNRDPFVRDLYAKVSELAHKMNLKIKFVEPWSEAGGANILDKVKYNVDYFNSNDYAQTKAGVLLHELIHSVTVYAVAAKNSSVLTQEMKDAVKQMEAIYDEIKDDPAFDGTYGAESVKEMVSELSNPRFRQKLRAKNLFQRIIDAIKQLLGIDKGTNALDNLEGTLEYMIENFDQNAFDAVLKANEQSDYYTRFSAVTDPAKIAELESGEKIKVYRAMQVIDGKLYPPMSAKVDGKMREPIELGQWEQAEERPDLVDAKGNFKLDKANKSSVPARYNPYIHTSASPLNDQFSSAQSRPNLVTVEVEIPASELTSGYKAEGAKDAVGQMEWKAGVVQSKLSGTRTVILSRWDKPIRIVPDSEVAAEIVKMFDGKNITMPSNVVTPSLRAELEKLGVPFVVTDNQGRPKAVTLFSALPTKNDFEVERKAMLGITMMHGFVPFDEMGNTFRTLINEREAMVQRLASKANKTAYDKERLARLEQDLEAAYRQLEWWENVQADLVPTDEVQPEVSKDMEPQSFEEYLSQFFTMSKSKTETKTITGEDGKKKTVRLGGKKMGVMLTPETLTSEMGWASGDWAGIRYIVSAKDGMSLDKIAEMIAEDEDAKQFLGNMDTMDIKNAVMDFLQSVGTYAEIRDYVKHQREAAAQEEANFANAQIRYNAQRIEEETGMSVDEYNAMVIEDAFKAAEENLTMLESSEINGNFENLTEEEYADHIESLVRAEEGRVYEGNEDFEGEQSGHVLPDNEWSSQNDEEGVGDDSQRGDSGSEGDRGGEAGGAGIPPVGHSKPGVVSDHLETEGLSVEEIVETGKQKVAAENADAADVFMQKLRKINEKLSGLRSALAAQREYDQNTVKILTSLANDLLEGGKLTDMTRGEIKRLLSVIKDATGKSDLSVSVDRLMDIMIANQLRFAKNRFADLLKIKASKVNASGVEAQGKLDVQGQQIMQSLKDAMKASEEVLNDWIAEAENDLDSDSDAVRHNAELKLAGYELARQYKEDIEASETEEAALREDLKKTEHEGKLTKEQLKEYRKTIYDAVRENKMARVNSYEAMLESLSSMLAGSVARAVAFREAETQRVENIHHMANSDMQGMPADEHNKKDSWFWNSSLVRFLFKPLATFDQMLRAFAPKSRSGEGYLWNHFMGGWLKATENEYKGIQDAHERLDAYVRYHFGVQRWSDLFALERKLPKAEVTWWNAGKMETFEVSQGNLLYIYMINKMADGRMKLRKMGITEDDVDNIIRSIDPRFLDLADWIQESFLPSLREKYNDVHERLFGAPMAAIDNYFPIRVLANARAREVDLGVDESNAKPSTITGNIIKRTKNSLALDILGSDAFDVVLGHIEEMEKWAAFAEWNKDLNTLLSYKKFRNRVQNMAGIYGAGNVVWNNFRSAAEIAAGVYKPATKNDSVDKAIMNIAKGVTGAKISFRVYTAFKQLLSWPAFLSDARTDILAKNMANPFGAWKWSMENLPLFEKRWKSRQAGDSRLMETESDWKIWKSKAVEIAGRLGMTPNAFVDAVTVAIGARSIYETRLKKYLDYGYSQEVAEEKAKRDATVLFNESQQSNESAFLSQIQVDRTVASVVFTVFRNSSMGYQRMYVDAIRNIGRMMKPGYKGESVEYMTKQMVRDGLTPEQAERAANRIYNRSFAKNAMQALTFGFIVQLAWNLGPYLPYIFGGDDDDKKKEMTKDAIVRALVGGPVEGLTGGNILSNAFGNLAMGESLSKVSGAQLPLTSDIENTFRLFGNDNVRAYNELFNLAVQSFVGVNPQTISDVVVAVIDACNGDLETSTEAMLCIMRILQVPQSQIENFYIDEIDFKADEAYDMAVQEFAERYAKYKVMRNAPLTQWMYTDEEEKKKEDKYIQLFTQKALEERKKRGSEEAKAWYRYVEGSEYKGIEQTLKDIRDQIEAEADAGRFGSDIIKAAQQKMIDLQKTPAFQKYMDAKMIKSQTDKLKEAPDWVDVSELKKMRKEKFDKVFNESNSVE